MKIVNPNSAVFVIIFCIFAEKIVQRPKRPDEISKRLLNAARHLRVALDALARPDVRRSCGQLLFDFVWMKTKLESTDANALIADFDLAHEEGGLAAGSGSDAASKSEVVFGRAKRVSRSLET